MNTAARILSVAALAWLGPAGMAAGQSGPAQSGHALDANPAVGGSGINQPVSPQFGAGGQYLITGQARMGRSFQGFVPYSSPSLFQGSLGSSALYDFNRDSASLPLVSQGGAGYFGPQALPYLQSPRAVFSAGDVPDSGLTGAARPGAPPVLNPFARPQYFVNPPMQSATYDPIEDLHSNPLAAPQAYSNVPLSERLNARQELMYYHQQWAEQVRALSTRPPPSAGQAVTGRPGPGQPQTSGPGPAGPMGPVDGRVDTQLRIQPESAFPGPIGRETTPPVIETPLPGPTAPGAVPPPGTEGQPGTSGQPREPAPGDDLYSDLLRRAEELAAELQATQPAPPAPAVPPPGQSPLVTPLPPALPPGPDVRSPIALPPAPPVAPVLELAVSYDSFASRSPTRANEELRHAEELMRQGQFYRALDRLARARRWDPGNPLIWLRACHAYVGAGEFHSAAVDLRQAIRIFPSVASVRTDLEGLMGPRGETLLADRMALLQRIGQAGSGGSQTSLWMLLCYLQQSTGRSAQAAQTAEFLLKNSASDPEAAALARYVLGKPASPTTQPDRP